MKINVLLGAVLGLAAVASAETPLEAQDKALVTMETQVVTLKFAKAPLSEVLAWLKQETGLDYIPMPRVAKSMHDGKFEIDVDLREVKLEAALRLTLANFGLAYELRLGKVFILSEEDAKQVVTEMYDLRSLVAAIQDFPGPKLGLPEQENGWGIPY